MFTEAVWVFGRSLLSKTMDVVLKKLAVGLRWHLPGRGLKNALVQLSVSLGWLGSFFRTAVSDQMCKSSARFLVLPFIQSRKRSHLTFKICSSILEFGAKTRSSGTKKCYIAKPLLGEVYFQAAAWGRGVRLEEGLETTGCVFFICCCIALLPDDATEKFICTLSN